MSPNGTGYRYGMDRSVHRGHRRGRICEQLRTHEGRSQKRVCRWLILPPTRNRHPVHAEQRGPLHGSHLGSLQRPNTASDSCCMPSTGTTLFRSRRIQPALDYKRTDRLLHRFLVRRRKPLAPSLPAPTTRRWCRSPRSPSARSPQSPVAPVAVPSADRRFVEDNRLGVDQLSSTNRLLKQSGAGSSFRRARPTTGRVARPSTLRR